MEIKHGASILTVNVGSSSIKIALFSMYNADKKILEAAVQNIGQPSATFTTPDSTTHVAVSGHTAATKLLVDWIATQTALSTIRAVGYRIVHGGPHYYQTCLATDETLADLRALTAFAPEHLPHELELVNLLRRLLPQAQHILCFDTAFHHNLPTQSRVLPLPRRFEALGVRRYGFHGLSYAYIMQELRHTEGDAAAGGKVIIAHLGSGASLTALHGARPVDTTMGMTPASGIPMSSRSGDLDPGLALYFAQTQGYNAQRFNQMVNFESGLLGMSGTTADMEKLLQNENKDTWAKDAVTIFCYQVKKSLGSFAAALGGLDTLVFTGGIGENAPKIRAKVCEGLEFLGVTLDAAHNQKSARCVSADGGTVGVYVIPTDEEVTIARETSHLINKVTSKE